MTPFAAQSARDAAECAANRVPCYGVFCHSRDLPEAVFPDKERAERAAKMYGRSWYVEPIVVVRSERLKESNSKE